MIAAIFEPDSTTAIAYGLWQWDYGQVLRIQGLNLPATVEIHFSLQETGGVALMRVGVTKDGVTDVVIPDSMLENDGITSNYNIFAFIYLTDATSGQTEYKIKLQIKSRPKPEVPGGGEDPDIFHEAVEKVKESADKAAESERQAEGWAHGREDLPERAEDNAKYYAGKTAGDAAQTAEDRKEIKRLVESVSGIDKQVEKVEELTKQAQGAADKAGESEQGASLARKGAEGARAAAEAAASKTAKDRTAVENSKTEVMQAKESVSSDRAAVEAAKQEIDQLKDDIPTAVQNGVHKVNDAKDVAIGEINKIGTAHKTAVEDAATKALQDVENVKQEATQAIETAKSEAVQAVQTEGTTQTGNVTAEGAKQVQAVETAAQEIIADREQIKTNKADIADLRQNKAGAVVETVSGEMIQAEDSAVAGFEGMRIFGKSTQDGTPNPDAPVPIESAGDDGEIGVDVTGKNLLNCYKLAELEPTYYSVEQGELKIIRGNSDAWTSLPEYGTLAAGTYTISGDNAEVRSVIDNISLAMCNYNGKPVSFTLNKDTIVKIKVGYGRDKYPYISNMMINAGKIITEYEPYRPLQSLTIPTSNGLPGIKVDSGENYTDSTGQQWVCDEIDLERGKYVQRIGVIENYTNEQINSAFMSTTGGLTPGAKVIYVLENPIETDLSPEMIEAYKQLHTNYPTTVITNDSEAGMEVAYVADTRNYIAIKIETPLQKQITDLQNALISQKISGGGIKVTDSARVPVVDFAMWGKTEQVSTTGTQLFNKATVTQHAYISDRDGSLNGPYLPDHASYDKNASDYILIPDGTKQIFVTKVSSSGWGAFYDAEKQFVSGITGYAVNDISINVPENAKYVRFTVHNNNLDDFMVTLGNTKKPYEPYSGGFPSPSPDWKQPVEVVDEPISITIQGGTEQQEVTLVPPRPLTRWDKLEKINGVWQWVYQSDTCMLSDIVSQWEEYKIAGLNQYYFKYSDSFSESNKNNIYADKFISWTIEKRENNYNTVYLGSVSICFNVNENEFPTLQSWEEWVSANPVNILYKTKTPEHIPLPPSAQDRLNALTMYDGATEITNNGGCQMELTYTVDTQKYVDAKIAEVSKVII